MLKIICQNLHCIIKGNFNFSLNFFISPEVTVHLIHTVKVMIPRLKNRGMISVIVIEDDLDGAEVLAECLRIKGINVLEKGHNGLEAVQLYKKLKPDFVLLDMLMPYYDGFYGLRKILEFDSNAKVIVVSASIAQDEKEKLTQLGASAIVSKPYEMDTLIGVLQTINKAKVANLKTKPLII